MKIFETKINSIQQLTLGLLNYADKFSFVIREEIIISKKTHILLDELKKFLVEEQIVTQWPGTILLSDRGLLFTYYLNREAALILSKNEDCLFEWRHPELPEDLVFYKNGVPIFISITHEMDAYFQIDDDSYLKQQKLL